MEQHLDGEVQLYHIACNILRDLPELLHFPTSGSLHALKLLGMIAGRIIAHALEGQMLPHLLHLLCTDCALQEPCHIADDLIQLCLHALVAGEEDVILVAQLPEVEHMWPAGREVHIAIDEGVHEVRLGALVAHHAAPVMEVRDSRILGIAIDIDDLRLLGPHLPWQQPGGQMRFDKTWRLQRIGCFDSVVWHIRHYTIESVEEEEIPE